ncbi:MAG: hypothetical protein RJA70_1410 [Pseudomonadota bacterium]|jgi:acetyl/propionyl-CoA carboxylase alpha subunit/acetyl-CoA carboxylase carboxyltransferase component
MRCIRAVKSLRALEGEELRVVALYTAEDRDAPFVRHADVAVELPIRTTAVASYLDHALLLRTLKRVGADAVWPGWGFVAESPEFVDRLTEAGIRFLGPRADTMRALGDKISSKILAEKVDVPVTRWSGGAVELEEARAHAERIGYPAVIKASAGGGGRGIRVVRDPAKFDELFRSAQSEALSAFGDGRMFVEAMVQGGRHIEVQIIADTHGQVFALGCRDCSVQRRHQKVLEEAPPVGLPPLMFRALKEAAIALADHVGYVGAGTVEFLVKGPDYFFLEMNPRLQVEHGITEEITGTDLVQLQIRVARGERLPDLSDPAFRERGYAIEARVCAEDPDAGFLPAPGKVARFDPALGPRLRIDTGVAQESTVPAAFDSLIAKVIASGDTREEAHARLACALRDFDLVIQGGSTNKGYLLELLDAEEFKAGAVDTMWLDRWNETRTSRREYAAEGLVLAALLSYRELRATQRANFFADASNLTQDKVPPSSGEEIDLNYGGVQYRTHVYASGAARYRVHMDGRVVSARLSVSGRHAARLVIGNRDLRVLYDSTEVSIRVEVEGVVHRFGRQTAGQVRSNAPSMVVALNVKVGDSVQAGSLLGLVEAMKMEIGFEAPVSGTVTEVRVRKGQQLAAGDVILVIDPKTDDGQTGAGQVRVELPLVTDPLALLFQQNDGQLGAPDLLAAAVRSESARSSAMSTVTEEIRRILLGYDAFPARVDKLIEFLSAPVPEDLPLSFCEQLVDVKRQLSEFVDVERLFLRSTRRRLGQGELEQLSNDALLRLYLRRMQVKGSGLPEGFVDALKKALAHYDETRGLEYGGALERAVIRLFATQLQPERRIRLVGAMLGRLIDLSSRGLGLEQDDELRQTLTQLASMRGQLPNSLADLAIEAVYLIFERPQLNAVSERTTRQVEDWLSQDHGSLASAPDLNDLALAPPGRFARVLAWLGESAPRRQAIARTASVRRLYAPLVPSEVSADERGIEALVFGKRRVLAVVAREGELAARLDQLLAQPSPDVSAIEVLLPLESADAIPEAVALAAQKLGKNVPAQRLTLSFVPSGAEPWHETFLAGGERAQLHGIHPETAARIDFQRYESFELERLDVSTGVVCFYGKCRSVPDDERVFVLAEVRGRPPQAGTAASLYVPFFQRAFYEAARTLRLVLGMRDPRRRLQWNRIVLFVQHPVVLSAGLAELLAQQLYPATRHLGLERVSVRLKVLADEFATEAEEQELVVSDPTGSHMEVAWRAPHSDPLEPVAAYQRSVVAARRRGLIYPYEILRMLAPGDEEITPTQPDPRAIPYGNFEEYDLDPAQSSPTALSVAGREPGKNKSAVVFGVICTRTRKVPEGMKRVLVLSDPTRGMGALADGECDRVVAAIDLADKLGVPLEWLPVSSGARIAMDSGTENLDATARVVRRIVTFTQAGGVIHIIVCGINVGAQSYWDSLATMLGHTRGILVMTPRASMVLTGRAALAASGSVSAEDEVAIGGYERVMGPNGQAQYYAEDLGSAYRILYQHYEYSYVVPGEKGPRPAPTEDSDDRDVGGSPYEASADFKTVGEIFDQRTNPGRKRPFAMRALLRAVADTDSDYLERWQAQVSGETAIIWDTHLGGLPISLIGIESQNVARWGYRPLDGPPDWNGGTLFPVSSKKIARALNAASGNRPVVMLANLSGFDGSPESMRKLQLEYGAEIARAVVNFVGPLVFLVVSRYHGGAYVVFSRELNPGLRAFAVEGSYASVIGGGPAAAVVFPREVQDRVAKDPRVIEARKHLSRRVTPEVRADVEKLLEDVRLEKQAELAAEFDTIHSVERAKQVGSLEDIVSATAIRPFLIRTLKAAAE